MRSDLSILDFCFDKEYNDLRSDLSILDFCFDEEYNDLGDLPTGVVADGAQETRRRSRAIGVKLPVR